MKINIFAYSVLTVLILGVVLNSIFIGNVTKELAEAVETVRTDDMSAATEEYESLFEKFTRAEKFISVTVSHDDLTNIEESFSEIIGAAKAGDSASVIREKSRLKDALLHLGRLSQISFGSVF